MTGKGDDHTVQNLIDHLMAIEDKSMRVDLEGCDCCGSWDGNYTIEERTWPPSKRCLYVLLTRDHSQ